MLPIDGDTGCWYEIFPTESGVGVSSHANNWATLRAVDDYPHFLNGAAAQTLKLGEFEPYHGSGPWGYRQQIRTVAAPRNNWAAFEVVYPQSEGHNEVDYFAIYAASHNLSFLIEVVKPLKEPARAEGFQLLTFPGPLAAENRMAGASFGVHVAPALTRHIAAKACVGSHPSRETNVELGMQYAWNHMASFRAQCESRWFRCHYQLPHHLFLVVPGNAVGLSPDMTKTPDPNQYWSLNPDNVDGPLQQLALISGIAQLHENARKEGY